MKILINIAYSILFVGLVLSLNQNVIGNTIIQYLLFAITALHFINFFINLKELNLSNKLLHLGLIVFWTSILLVYFKHSFYIYFSLTSIALISYYYLRSLLKNYFYYGLLTSLIISISIIILRLLEVKLNPIVLALSLLIIGLMLIINVLGKYFNIKSVTKHVNDIDLSGYRIILIYTLTIVLSNLELIPNLYSSESNIEKSIDFSDKSNDVILQELDSTYMLINEIIE